MFILHSKKILKIMTMGALYLGILLRLFNARDIAYIYWGVKQRYDGKISCEYIPVNRGKASEAGAKI
jgi:hypothetical protein